MDHSSAFFYLVIFSVAGMLLARGFKAGKKGIAAIKFEAVYLGFYCFLCGVLCSFAITNTNSDFAHPIWMVVMLVALFAGFSMRALVLFRMIKQLADAATPEKK